MNIKNSYSLIKKFTSFASKLFPFLMVDIKGNLVIIVQNVLKLISKTYAGFCVILFFVVLGGAGFVLFPIGLILLISKLVVEDIDKVILIGSLLCVTGVVYIIIAIIATYISFRLINKLSQVNADDLLKK